MEPNEFPGNSNAEKPVAKKAAGKKIEKLDIGEVKTRKKPLGRKIKEFIVGDDSRSVVSYVWFEILVPGAKDMVFDSFTQGMERKIYGEVRSARRRGQASGLMNTVFGGAQYNAYNRYASGGSALRPDPRQAQPNRRGRMQHMDLQEIIFAERFEATECLDAMIAIVAQYETVSVSDLWELLGRNGEHTDEKWGWSDLMGTDVIKVPEGYLLDLPKPHALD